MKYVVEVTVCGIEEAGLITNLFDREGHETTELNKATTCLVQCSVGFIPLVLDDTPIFTVH